MQRLSHLRTILPRPSEDLTAETSDTTRYLLAEVYLFDTCTHRCGYCWLAESGQVLEFAQLEPFRSVEWISRVAGFFNRRTTPHRKWLLQFTGGEPLMAPNLDLLCRSLFEHGNRVAFYTALLLGRQHPGFRFLSGTSSPDVDYIMASLHPEGEQEEDGYFEKVRILRDCGHKVFVRYVGHPKRLGRLDELASKCADLDVCFYPTTLLSNTYPASYSVPEREILARHFSSVSQHIQLQGGIDTTGTRCHAGSRVIGVNLQTGNITPCITVPAPILGNVFLDEMRLEEDEIICPSPGINCVCDIHFQHHIVIGADDRDRFERQKSGFVPPEDLENELERMRRRGMRFYGNPVSGMGNVADEGRLFFTIDEVRANYRRRHNLSQIPGGKTDMSTADLKEVTGAFDLCRAATQNAAIVTGHGPVCISTDPRQWAYAALFPLSDDAASRLDSSCHLIVRIEATVEEGRIGFAIASPDLDAFISAEEECDARPERVTPKIIVDEPRPRVSVVVRNTAAGGVVSKVQIHSIKTYLRPQPESSRFVPADDDLL